MTTSRVPLLLTVLAMSFLVGCDTNLESTANSTPAPPAPPATPSGPTPAPKHKPGDWLFKDYKNPLTPPDSSHGRRR